jgi:hypothetical protein
VKGYRQESLKKGAKMSASLETYEKLNSELDGLALAMDLKMIIKKVEVWRSRPGFSDMIRKELEFEYPELTNLLLGYNYVL